jgi:hypothetical protein
MTRLSFVKQCLGKNLILWLGLSVAFALCYYLILMAALIIRFENFPNYLNAFDWRFNVQRIWVSTPSLLDTLSIIRDEWLFEIGFMNYAYGTGISEWSLFIAPAKVLTVLLLGAAVTANFLLLRATVAAGLGTTFVSLASITMSWVVCCSTPTWVVGLAMMGLGVSTSLWLEPIGIWVNTLGYVFLLVAMFIAASRATTET